jgi:hypothetical protein
MNRRNLLRAFGTTGLGLALGGTARAAPDHNASSAPGGKQQGPLDATFGCAAFTAPRRIPKFR